MTASEVPWIDEAALWRKRLLVGNGPDEHIDLSVTARIKTDGTVKFQTDDSSKRRCARRHLGSKAQRRIRYSGRSQASLRRSGYGHETAVYQLVTCIDCADGYSSGGIGKVPKFSRRRPAT
jgi:hypothetical protein